MPFAPAGRSSPFVAATEVEKCRDDCARATRGAVVVAVPVNVRLDAASGEGVLVLAPPPLAVPLALWVVEAELARKRDWEWLEKYPAMN